MGHEMHDPIPLAHGKSISLETTPGGLAFSVNMPNGQSYYFKMTMAAARQLENQLADYRLLYSRPRDTDGKLPPEGAP